MAIIRVQAPDGSIIRMEAPDNATEEQIAQAVQAYTQSAQVPAQAPKPETGIIGGIKEAITGAERATEATRTLPEWTSMPELNELSIASAKTGLGTLLSNPEETVQVIKANYPNTQVRQDEKGNFILKSSVDNQEYAIPPGFSIGDIPRAIGGMAAFTPAGRATSIAGAGAASAGTQAAIEASQAMTGGAFSPEQVALTGAGGAAIPAAMNVVSAAKQPVSQAISRMTGRAETPSTQAAPIQAAQQPIEQAAAQAAPEIAGEELGAVIKRASGGGMGAAKAQEELATLAKINPQAKSEADRLGIELPPDVFSDSQMVREAAGLTRSVAGSEASGAWRDVVRNASERADNVMREIDASPDLSSVSDAVIGNLNRTRDGLAQKSREIYDQVDAAVPKDSIISLPKLRETLQQISSEVGKDGLSQQEKKLMAMMDSGNVTYGRLAREKSLLGQAIAGKDSPYGNMEAGSLKRLYAALAEDQLTNVGNIGGEELRKQLRGANLLFAQQRGLEKRIVNAFGNESTGSIANLMRRAIDSGSKGDVTAINKLLKVVPPELHKETIATALMAVTRAKGGAEKGGFGFSEFANTYRGLRNNSQIYAQVVKSLGKENAQMLQDLYGVSKRITDARANVLTTGKANQALVNSLNAENFIGKMLETVAGKAAVTGAAAAGGGAIGGSIASVLTSAMSGGKKDAITAAGKMFASEEFKKAATEAATKPQLSTGTVRRLALSKQFKDFANKVKMPRTLSDREKWIFSAIQANQQF